MGAVAAAVPMQSRLRVKIAATRCRKVAYRMKRHVRDSPSDDQRRLPASLTFNARDRVSQGRSRSVGRSVGRSRPDAPRKSARSTLSVYQYCKPATLILAVAHFSREKSHEVINFILTVPLQSP